MSTKLTWVTSNSNPKVIPIFGTHMLNLKTHRKQSSIINIPFECRRDGENWVLNYTHEIEGARETSLNLNELILAVRRIAAKSENIVNAVRFDSG